MLPRLVAGLISMQLPESYHQKGGIGGPCLPKGASLHRRYCTAASGSLSFATVGVGKLCT